MKTAGSNGRAELDKSEVVCLEITTIDAYEMSTHTWLCHIDSQSQYHSIKTATNPSQGFFKWGIEIKSIHNRRTWR